MSDKKEKYKLTIRLDVGNGEDRVIAEFLRHQYNINQLVKDIIYDYIKNRNSSNAPLIVNRNDFANQKVSQNAGRDASAQKITDSKKPKSKIEESNSTPANDVGRKEYDRYVNEEKPFDLTVDLFKNNTFK
ncbi:hypothetical protein [Limosilactobacillus allomucosae]|uniref:hypothetical protein n=1 Tax=Limosilactobacillus allomucosae TaxID=3142938 RepID=UPI0032645905